MADFNINKINIPYQPIQIKPVKSDSPEIKKLDESFEKIFNEALNKGIKFSGHAINRLQSRKIDFTPDKVERLTRAIQQAETQGAKESLVLMDDLALIVSIKNNTVITALNGDAMKENVFTNIDSAIIV